MNAVVAELYRARAIARIGEQTVVGPWVEYGSTAVDGVYHAVQESTELLFRNLRRTAALEGQAEKRPIDGQWPSESPVR